MNNTKEQVEELSSILYEDLKEKYITQKQKIDYLINRHVKKDSKIRKITSDLYLLRYGRQQFNFAIKLSKLVVQRIAVNYQLDLNAVVQAINEIEELKRPPITDENVHILNIPKEYKEID